MASFLFFSFFLWALSFNTAAISFTPCPHDLHTAALNVKHKPLSASLLLCQRVMGWWPFWRRVLELWYLLFYLGPGLWKWSSLLRAGSQCDSQTPTLTEGATRSNRLPRARNHSRQFTTQDAQLFVVVVVVSLFLTSHKQQAFGLSSSSSFFFFLRQHWCSTFFLTSLWGLFAFGS